MPNNSIFWVKLERSLFRKPEWTVTVGGQKIGLHKDGDAALAQAVSEAERISPLGLSSEIWVDDGMGFTLYKAYRATKPEVPDEDDEDSSDDADLDESTYL